MKRITELQPLSRDHHHALVLAKRCKQASASGDQAACNKLWREVKQVFIDKLRPNCWRVSVICWRPTSASKNETCSPVFRNSLLLGSGYEFSNRP